MTESFEFDVFLAHNGADKPAVREVAAELEARGLRVWFDESALQPGRPWPDGLAEGVESSRTIAVLVGRDGIGPWQRWEMRGAVAEFVERGAAVIPVLLPGAAAQPKLPLLLKLFTWVDLRNGLDKKGIGRLVWGVTDGKPEEALLTQGHRSQLYLDRPAAEVTADGIKDSIFAACDEWLSIEVAKIETGSTIATIECDSHTMQRLAMHLSRVEVLRKLMRELTLTRVKFLNSEGEVVEELDLAALGAERLFDLFYVGDMDREAPGQFPPSIVLMRDWAWGRTAMARWRRGSVDDLSTWLANARVVVFDWPTHDPRSARRAYAELRYLDHIKPVVILKRGPGREAVRESAADEDWTVEIEESDLASADKLQEAFAALGIEFPAPEVTLANTDSSLETRALSNWLGVDRLRLIVQSFFPEASQASLSPAGGGWSGVSLCNLFVENGERGLYFVKFLTNQERYRQELIRHAEAAKWLGDALVRSKLVPNLGDDVENQMEAFPATSRPCAYPACYESAAGRHPRQTLNSIYHEKGLEHDLQPTYTRLLDILADGQQPTRKHERPGDFLDRDTTGRYFTIPNTDRIAILAASTVLSPYGRDVRPKWDQRHSDIENLFYAPLPPWLDVPLEAAKGFIHGDPSSQKCLVHSNDGQDLKLIDAGGFQRSERLVFDLARIEADVKLRLMATETESALFRDLDITRVDRWCQAEKRMLKYGLDGALFDPAGKEFTADSAVQRAYQLVAIVRGRAVRICGDTDANRRHYFAALLFWTLNSLASDSIPQTKKLLAIFSASEILRRFK